VRQLLAAQHSGDAHVPDVQVVAYEREGDRSLTLRHSAYRDRPLSDAASEVVRHLHRLWGFPVRLETWNGATRVGNVLECAS
jgi:spore cortex formation protein SpoVR/YcgB (stage V sporulation)